MRFTLRMLALVIVALVVSVSGLQTAHANSVAYLLPAAGTYIDTSQSVTVGANVTVGTFDTPEVRHHLRVTVFLNGDGLDALFHQDVTSGTTYPFTYDVSPTNLQNSCINGQIQIGLRVRIQREPEPTIEVGESHETYNCGNGPAPEVLYADPSNFVIDAQNCGDQNDVVRYVQPNVSVTGTAWNGNDLVFTLQANIGYTFAGGTTTTITYTDPGDCVIQGEIPPPIRTEHCGSINDQFVNADELPTGANPDFTVTWNEDVATITYSALEGYTFASGATTSFTFTDINTACIPGSTLSLNIAPNAFSGVRVGDQVWVSATLSLASGEYFDHEQLTVLTGSSTTPSSSHSFENGSIVNIYFNVPVDDALVEACEGGTVSVSASAVITGGDAPGVISSTTVDVPCNILPALIVISGDIPAPTHIQQCGPTNDTFENADGLPTGVNRDFTVTWNDDVATITYSAEEGYVFAPGAVTTFTFTDEGKACFEPSISVVPDVDDPFVDIRFGETTVPITVTLDLPAGEKYLIADINVKLDGFIFLTPYEESLSEIGEWPADFEYIIELNGSVLNHICDDGVIEMLTDATVHTEVTWFDIESELVTYPCNVLFPVTPDTELIVVTDVCGPNNDEIAFEQENVIATIGNWEDGEAVISFQPAEGYYFPQGTVEAHTVTDDASDCVIEPAALPDLAAAICGPNNDAISLPDQPEGVLVEDSGWGDNERTITLAPDNGYAFPVGTATEYRYEDESIPCEDPEPGVTQVTVLLVTSDGGSIEGTPYQLYAPVASQVPSAPFIEGEVAAGNRIVIINLVAGQYRLVLAPAGYEEVDTVLTVTESEDTQVITVEVAAVQVPVTPTPSPTPEPTASPTPSPTSETAAPVSGLPSTGAGSGNGNLMAVILSAVAAITVLAWIGGTRLGTNRR